MEVPASGRPASDFLESMEELSFSLSKEINYTCASGKF
jgi:hypothetical protein